MLSWTSVTDLGEEDRETGDPLGFRAAAGRWAGALVPVFTAACDLPRQLSVFCLCLRAASDSKGADRESFLRSERLWLLALARDGRLAGNLFSGGQWARSQMKRLRKDGDADLTVSALSDQLAAGLWGRTRRAAAELDLISHADRGGGPEHWSLTGLGQELAADAQAELLGPKVPLAKYAKRGSVTSEDLVRLFGWELSNPREAGKDENKHVAKALRVQDEHRDDEFQALYSTWKMSGTLSLTVPKDQLRPAQQGALRVLRAVDSLSRAIEKPYRAWLRGEQVALAGSIAKGPGWAILVEAGEGELLELRDLLDKSRTFEAVQEFHELLAERRGSRWWSKSTVENGETVVPAFRRVEHRLDCANSLFASGVVVGAVSS
jgi:hypothetical protein